MNYILFPGRHLATTAFQEECVRKLCSGQTHGGAKPTLVFAITSANQENSRYNPIPLYVRAIGLDRFARDIAEDVGIQYHIIPIPHFPPTENFADYLIKEVREASEERLLLTSENTLVLSSTREVIDMYRKRHFSVNTAELDETTLAHKASTPVELIQRLADAGEAWKKDELLLSQLSAATRSLWGDFPEIPRHVMRLWRDPLLLEHGDLTETRNYSTYASGLGHTEIIKVKYSDVRDAIKTGKIVDEGCADGALLAEVAKDFPDSDLIGIEITGELIARAQERQRAGDFGGTFVHFHQRNILDKIFEGRSIDTTICNSTLHELWSYGEGEKSIGAYLDNKYAQLRDAGRLIIRDVVGPEDQTRQVYMKLKVDDGLQDDPSLLFSSSEEKSLYLQKLSTEGRFLRFAREYLHGAGFPFEVHAFNDGNYFSLRLKDAVEFMTKKDYLDDWDSELHEEFAFWSFGEWKSILAQKGFRVLENPNDPSLSSRVYTNEWIVLNRWKDKISLFEMKGDNLIPIAYPPTTMILIAEKA